MKLYKAIKKGIKLYKAIKKGILIFLILFISGMIFIAPFRQVVIGAVDNYIAQKSEEATQERIEQASRGEPVWGKDTVLIWGKKYSIFKNGIGNGKELLISETGTSPRILSNIICYMEGYDNLLVISEEGYAIIDSDNICRVYITVPKEEFEKGYYEDENGNREYYSGYCDNKLVRYLESFEEYSDKEQEEIKEAIWRIENPEEYEEKSKQEFKEKPIFEFVIFSYLLPGILITILIICIEKRIRLKRKEKTKEKTKEETL